ncbi:hypothetical protein BCV70DRAFT_206501 [Testicularia cyperi]|uniref:Velvet domain-containing protein n=1 Tax=Testicularia cyperi TaxID=1882483 RepID=A0A317XQS3_9BASI|nr:hypothetical protein BCV70DRAFT_206501 [Testicularia cyperi]
MEDERFQSRLTSSRFAAYDGPSSASSSSASPFRGTPSRTEPFVSAHIEGYARQPPPASHSHSLSQHQPYRHTVSPRSLAPSRKGEGSGYLTSPHDGRGLDSSHDNVHHRHQTTSMSPVDVAAPPSHASTSNRSDWLVLSSVTHALRMYGDIRRETPRFALVIRQQPRRGLAIGNSQMSLRTARSVPLDPPPVCELLIDRNGDEQLLSLPEVFVRAQLVKAEASLEECLPDARRNEPLVGDTLQSPFNSRIDTREDQSFFVFKELGVRNRGFYRLRFDLFDRVGLRISRVASIYSDIFEVQERRKHPGLMASSALMDALVDRGMKYKLRKAADKQGTKKRKSPEDFYYGDERAAIARRQSYAAGEYDEAAYEAERRYANSHHYHSARNHVELPSRQPPFQLQYPQRQHLSSSEHEQHRHQPQSHSVPYPETYSEHSDLRYHRAQTASRSPPQYAHPVARRAFEPRRDTREMPPPLEHVSRSLHSVSPSIGPMDEGARLGTGASGSSGHGVGHGFSSRYPLPADAPFNRDGDLSVGGFSSSSSRTLSRHLPPPSLTLPSLSRLQQQDGRGRSDSSENSNSGSGNASSSESPSNSQRPSRIFDSLPTRFSAHGGGPSFSASLSSQPHHSERPQLEFRSSSSSVSTVSRGASSSTQQTEFSPLPSAVPPSSSSARNNDDRANQTASLKGASNDESHLMSRSAEGDAYRQPSLPSLPPSNWNSRSTLPPISMLYSPRQGGSPPPAKHAPQPPASSSTANRPCFVLYNHPSHGFPRLFDQHTKLYTLRPSLPLALHLSMGHVSVRIDSTIRGLAVMDGWSSQQGIVVPAPRHVDIEQHKIESTNKGAVVRICELFLCDMPKATESRNSDRYPEQSREAR